MSNQGSPDQGQDPSQATLRAVSTTQSRGSRESVDLRRTSTSSHGHNSIASGLRHRNPTRRQRQQFGQSQPYATGRDQNGRQPFTLAGPEPQDGEHSGRSQNQHRPYVEPGYTELNPAYDQPGNVRPIWGLADPMPRVVRRGMKPSNQDENDDVLQPTDSQMEQGIGPRLNLNKIDKSIHDATQDRERMYAEKYGKKFKPPSETGQVSHTQPFRVSQQLGPSQEAEEDIGSRTPPGQINPARHHRNRSEVNDKEEDEETTDEDVDPTHGQGEDDHVPLNKSHEELHNHHTLWAVLRTKLREPLAEILAVFVLMTIGICANIAHNIANKGSNDSIAWSWGFGTMTGIYISGGVSGGHLNPAITIMLYVFRGFPKKRIPVYIVAQLLGSYIGSLVAYGIYRNRILNYMESNPEQITQVYNSFVTNRVEGIADAASGFLTEFVATAFVGVVVLALGDDSNAPPGAGMNAFILGLVISIMIMAFSASTGATLNPARDMGPRLALITVGFNRHELFGDGWWIYGAWCAPISGGIVGAILYDTAIFVGGESPINYPKDSVKRAGSKAKARWRHRFKRRER
ncbi:aquaporin-like protein [Aureobasidium sp. EXF-10728]|nr:aquaporin-like protein [Aureobasidium sp. EXF-10728]